MWIRAQSWEDTWRRAQQPTPVFLPGESHGLRSLVGYSPQGRKESDTTEQLHFHCGCYGDYECFIYIYMYVYVSFIYIPVSI